MIRMNSKFFFEKLKQHDLTAADACEIIFIETRAVIKSKHILGQLSNYGKLSHPQSAAFSYMFKNLERVLNAQK